MVTLPKYLTPMQAVAWVSLRDPAMVDLAGDLKTPSPGHVAEVMLPSGLAVETLAGRPGLSRLKMIAYHAAKQDAGDLLVLPPDDAERELLAELREGRITAHGRTSPKGRAEPIPLFDWQDMGLSDGGDGRANALFACTLYPDGSPTGLRAAWQDVRLEGADLMRRWPPIPSREERSAAWAIREAEIALAVKASEDGRDARPGFMWAGDALRHTAWGEVVYPHPAGMSPVEAFAKVKAASQRLCDALAVGEIQATGRRGKKASGRYATSERTTIPRQFFEPGIAINLASWAAPDDGGCMADYALRREEEAPDWGRVMLDATEVEIWCAEMGEAPLGAQYRTGAPGRPSSAQLVEAEFLRRRGANEACQSLAAEARYLEQWLRGEHPWAPRMTEGTIKNRIRPIFRSATK